MEENTQTNTTMGTDNASSGNTMMFVIGAIVLAGILGYVIFSSANNNTPTTTEEPAVVNEDNTTEATDEEVQAVPETQETDITTDPNTLEAADPDETIPQLQEFEIEAGSFYYKPNVITVNKGDTVRIILNSADAMHDFNIDELGVDMEVVQSGQTATVEFTADEAGSFEFYCSVGQHRANGQVGTLVVQDL